MEAGDAETLASIKTTADLWEDAEAYWQAWWKLHYRRPQLASMNGVIPQPLTWSEVSQYGRDTGLAQTQWDVEELDRFMMAMDRVYFEHLAAQQAKQPKKPTGDAT